MGKTFILTLGYAVGRISRRLLGPGALLLALADPGAASDELHGDYSRHLFQRIASFPVFLNTDVNTQTSVEIVSVSEDGTLLLYTDSPTENLGFVSIANPYEPKPKGVLGMGGEPTSVAVAGPYALVAANTSESFSNPSGKLVVVDVENRAIVRRIDLGGQPDSVAVSPDKRYAAIAIENERDEEAGDGRPPQSPPGFVVIVDLHGQPDDWSTRKVDLVGIPELFPEDPEPEYVDINARNVAAVSLQENNHLVLIHLPSGKILEHWNAGSVDLQQVDVIENDLIELEGELIEVPREPDAVAWVSPSRLATADEGDLDGGSRGFTVFNRFGQVKFSVGNSLEHQIQLPDAVNALQRRFGFEGVATVGQGDEERVYVAFQREWVNEPDHRVRIGRYETARGQWTFFYYPIDEPSSPNGGWVGLSELVALEADTFGVIERDDQAGNNARIKKIYAFSIAGLEPQTQGGTFPVVDKTLVHDLVPDLKSPNGVVLEKVEGLAVTSNGDAFIVTDNDGVDDSSGETQFLRLGDIFDRF